MSWASRGGRDNSENGFPYPAVKHQHDNVDQPTLETRQFKRVVWVVPGLLKADIDSAFRRVPARDEHKWAGGVAFKLNGQVCCSIVICAYVLLLPHA